MISEHFHIPGVKVSVETENVRAIVVLHPSLLTAAADTITPKEVHGALQQLASGLESLYGPARRGDTPPGPPPAPRAYHPSLFHVDRGGAGDVRLVFHGAGSPSCEVHLSEDLARAFFGRLSVVLEGDRPLRMPGDPSLSPTPADPDDGPPPPPPCGATDPARPASFCMNDRGHVGDHIDRGTGHTWRAAPPAKRPPGRPRKDGTPAGSPPAPPPAPAPPATPPDTPSAKQTTIADLTFDDAPG